MGKNRKQTSTFELDEQSQQYVDQFLRPLGQRAATGILGMPGFGPESYRQYMNPYESQVVDATRADFGRARDMASQMTDQQATAAGAFGGSRQAVLEGTRLGEIDRAEADALARLRYGGFRDANQMALTGQGANIEQYLSALRAANLGMGPTSGTTTQVQPGNFFADVFKTGLGAAQVAGGLGWSPFGG